ncbi:hypothetical protein [Clostridium sp.]|uniref:hypothetical protein n=1 Tax=Clostridium sp. TaxID=1506 RepID=UPI002FDC8AEF
METHIFERCQVPFKNMIIAQELIPVLYDIIRLLLINMVYDKYVDGTVALVPSLI